MMVVGTAWGRIEVGVAAALDSARPQRPLPSRGGAAVGGQHTSPGA